MTDSGMPNDLPRAPRRAEGVDESTASTAELSAIDAEVAEAGPSRPSKPSKPSRAARKATRTARGVALASARAAAGAVGIGVAVAAILTAGLVPLPSAEVEPAKVVVTPVPTAQQLVCAGSLLRLGNESGEDATTATSLGTASRSYAATAGDVTTRTLESSVGDSTIVSVAPEPGETEPALVSGSQSQVLSTSDFSGLAAVDCSAASTESWLVGGSTAVGRTTLITLANPSDVQSTVALGIYDEQGKMSAPGSTGIVVPARGQRVLSLAGFAPETTTPVIHVTSKGGQIVANLQQSISRGLEPGGVDIVSATALPATEQLIPGLDVVGASNLDQRLGTEGSSDIRTVLRLLLPGDAPAEATITVVAESAGATESSFAIALEAGVVTDVPIEGLLDGRYTVSVSTPEPVVAGVRLSTASQAATGIGVTDFAWLAAPAPISTPSVFTVANGPSPELTVTNPGSSALEVTFSEAGGTEQVLALEGGASVVVPVAGRTSYSLDPTAPIVAAVGYTGDGKIAAYPVREPLSTSGRITIYP